MTRTEFNALCEKEKDRLEEHADMFNFHGIEVFVFQGEWINTGKARHLLKYYRWKHY